MLHKVLRIVLSPYFLILFLFAVWVLFFDQFNIRQHRVLKKEYNELKRKEKYYRDEIYKDSVIIQKMKNDPEYVEKIAREKFYFRKADEVIFVIDSTLSDSSSN